MKLKAETTVRAMTEEYFSEVLKRIPSIHQDPNRLVRYLDISFAEVARLTGQDLSDAGLKSGHRLIDWPDGSSEVDGLKARLMSLASEVSPSERIFESPKPIAKGIRDLEKSLKEGEMRWKQYLDLQRLDIADKLPNAVVIGTQSSSTTWLKQALAAHPEVFVHKLPMLEFFCSFRYQLGINWYKQQFADWAEEPVGVEFSEDYFVSPETPGLLYNHVNGASLKLILLLREPVSRARSVYDGQFIRGKAPRSFERSIKMRYFRKLYIETGHYYRYY